MSTRERIFMSKRVDVLGRKLATSRRKKRTPSPVPGGKLRKEHVAAHLGFTVATVDRKRANDPTFPRPFLLGRTPLWDRAEIEAWLASKRA